MNAQQLKNAILQEAIEGRLVPQDPNDEPASALLARIRKEKEQLVKAGKLKKKDLEVKPISEDEIPFEIPESWEWVRLKSLVSVLGDGIHGTPEYDITGSYYFINGNNLSNNKIVIKADTKKVNEKEYQTYMKELNDKTILVSINGTIGNVGHYNSEPVILGKSACYYNLLDIRLKSYITMLMYTDYFLKYAVENATGSTIKNVSLAVMNDFLVPFPPVAEQHRIVAKIEELLPKVEEYGKAQDALNKLNEELPERLKKSVLQEAITGHLVPQDPNDEPASVLLQRIRAEKERLVKEGKLKKKDLVETPISEDEIPFEIPESWEWVRIGSIFSMQAGKNVTAADIKAEKSEKFTYQCYGGNGIRGYVAKYNTTGCFPLVGRQGALCGNVNIAEGNFWATEHAVVTNGFGLTEILWQYYFLTALNLNKLATATAQPGLAVSNVIESLIPLPPLAEQKRIVAKIEELFAVLDSIKESLEA
jgi:type I restriction enzyme S subunit